MKSVIAIAVFCALLPGSGRTGESDLRAASVLARADVFRNPIESFSVDVELTSFAPGGKTDISRFRVSEKGVIAASSSSPSRRPRRGSTS